MNMADERIKLGRKGEKIAGKFLKHKGYKIVQRNYRCRFGEIDLIAVDGEYLVFVEVKTRSESGAISPKHAVGPAKQRRIARLAAHFLCNDSHVKAQPFCRFDVVAVTTDPGGGRPSVELIQNAFQLEGIKLTI